MLIANALLNFELFAQRGNTNALFVAEVLVNSNSSS
jgi:hypothetical protein